MAGGVYPRVCGGTARLARREQSAQGLSPRVRGNLGVAHRVKDSDRVYPRVCGGTRQVAGPNGTPAGLSPRVRGNPSGTGSGVRSQGSIPACAGEPPHRPRPERQRQVYPRVCGGTAADGKRSGNGRGLSPRVRGNHSVISSSAKILRSIPACAGEPPPTTPAASTKPVYPRVCGGTVRRRQAWTSMSGLSPRVRGNPHGSSPSSGRRGSIPACAGEPPALIGGGGDSQVYPRVCGGTYRGCPMRRLGIGLSPRVRGNRQGVNGGVQDGGSIPACAGEPPEGDVAVPAAGVYPRVCGGTCARRFSGGRFLGLSPRVRGNPLRR